jgi:hypothetical protein
MAVQDEIAAETKALIAAGIDVEVRSEMKLVAVRQRRDAGAVLCARVIAGVYWSTPSLRPLVFVPHSSTAPILPNDVDLRAVLERLIESEDPRVAPRLAAAQILRRLEALGDTRLAEEDDAALAAVGS